MTTGTQRFKRTVVSRAAIAALWGTAAMLASQETLAQQQSSTTLQRVEITGSNIKRTDTETASPVQVLTREDIEKTGKQSIQEVLRGITADGLGSIPTAFSNGFASGSAAVSLRGLGVNATLVLVNGRRMTTYGLADDGQRNFVDLNSLPLEAVDRIEVLKDGASAIYGADAVGGVVNVILRKNYQGKVIGGSFGATNHGDGKTTRAFGSIGFGDVDTDKYNLFLTLEASKQDKIWARDRGFLGESDLRSKNFYDTTNGADRQYFFGAPVAGINPVGPSGQLTTASLTSPFGIYRLPGAVQNILPCGPLGADVATGLCRYNILASQQVQPEIDRLNFFTRGTLGINSNTTAYAELGLFNTRTKSVGTLGAIGGGRVFSGDIFAPAFRQPNPILPAGHPDNALGIDVPINYGFNDFGGRTQDVDNTVARFFAGLQGTGFGWDYDTAVGYIRSELKSEHDGFPTVNGIQAGLNNFTYRLLGPNGRNSADVLALVAPTLSIKPTSSVALIDFKANRELANLPGGPLGVAVGAEARREKANTPDYPGTNNGQVIGLGFSSFAASRSVLAAFAEVNAPILKTLELSEAVRVDHYSDFGDAVTPKVGFKLKPIDAFAIRGTYSEAFRAPGPAESGGSSFGFTNIAVLSAGNPNIKPEKARSYTLGIIAEPFNGFSTTLDYWRINRKNEIVQADPAAIGGAATGVPNSQVPGNVPGSLVIYNEFGNRVAVSAPFTNAAKTMTDGIDLDVKYRMNLGSWGKATTTLSWTHVNHYRRTDAAGNTFEYAGTHGPIVQSSGSGTPRDRISFTAGLEQGPWSVTAAVNYIGKIKLVDHRGETATDNGDGTITDESNGNVWNWDGVSSLNCGAYNLTGQPYNNCKLPSFTTVDLFAKWTVVKNLDLNLTVQNLFDRKAPFDPYLPLTYGVNWNQGWHQAGAVGRFISIGAKYSF